METREPLEIRYEPSDNEKHSVFSNAGNGGTTMCWSCNPYCGGCKPPKEKPVKCPMCKAYNFRDESSVCKKCGSPLPPPIPRPTVLCLYIGQLCANPCNKHKTTSEDGTIKSCSWHTPPKSGNAMHEPSDDTTN